MRKTVQTVLYIAAIAGAAAGSLAVARYTADELETRTGAAVRGALSEAGIDWAWVEIDGMQATLRGPAQDEAARFRALATAGAVLNPVNLRDEMTVAVPIRRPATDFRLEIMRNGDSVLLHGFAPAAGVPSPADLGGGEPGLEIVDLVARSAEPAPEPWPVALDAAVAAMDRLRTARIIDTPERIVLEGIAPDRATAQALDARMMTVRAAGLDATLALSLPRPVLSPFVTRFVLEDGVGRLPTCAAESAEGRQRILAAAQAAWTDPDATCQEALGAPDPDWSRIVAEAITLVAAAGAGSVTVSDLTITFALPDTARDGIDARLADFSAALPPIYRVSRLQAGAGTEATASLRFTATRSPEGLVNLRGPVGALDARQIVETLASARFGTGGLHTALQGGSGFPDDWPVQVMAAIDALAQLDSGAITLTPGLLHVRGRSTDPGTESALADALDTAFGGRLAYRIDLSIVEPEAVEPLPAVEVAPDPAPPAEAEAAVPPTPDPAECVARINRKLAENEVSFPSGSVELDEDGRAIVAGIAEVLRECPDVAMEIGGHTDSRGSESMNQLLSQARADAVLNALVAEDLAVDHLTVRGYGETAPIADNDTAEGREANRRIRFSLIGPDGTVIAAAEEEERDG